MPLPGSESSSSGKGNDDTHFKHTFDIKVINSEAAAVRIERSIGNPRIYAVAQCNGMRKRTEAVEGKGTSDTKTTYWWNETFRFSFEGGRNDDIEFTIDLYQIGGAKNNEDKWLGRARRTLIESVRNKDIYQELAESKCSISFCIGDIVTTPYHNTEPRMFVLIIGIDEYFSKDIPDLAGSLNDAKDMEDFFENDLHLPKSNICALYNKDATRQNIISSFKTHLLENDKITNGGDDSMVIFFAGHGNRAPAPEGWPITPNGYIEVICSYDYLQSDKENKTISAIPDRTINALVRSLADVKGNNITLIFDSCHSGGMGRDTLPSGDSYRSFNIPIGRPIIADDVDKDIWAAHRITAGFKHKDMASNVLLAACSQDEVAHEGFSGGKPRGVFTAALVKKLRELNRSSLNVSYTQLIESLLPLRDNQTPQCEGEFKRSPLFTAKPTSPASYFPLTKVQDSGHAEWYEVPLGAFHGVTGTTQFRVRITDKNQRELGPILEPVEVSGNSSRFRTDKGSLPVTGDDAEVSIWNWNNEQMKLRVFLDFKNTKFGTPGPPGLSRNVNAPSGVGPAKSGKQYLEKIVEDALQNLDFGQATGNFRRVYTDTMDPGAHISLRIDDSKQFTIKRCRNFLPNYPDIKGIAEYRCHDPLEKGPYDRSRLLRIMDGIFLFRYHLLRELAEHPLLKVSTGTPNTASVQMHLFYLSSDKYGVMSPTTGRDLFTTQRRARVLLSDLTFSRFGFEITNNYDEDLYAYLLWFDPDCYSIEHWYLPQNSSNVLKQNESLTIGYGARGGDPFEFCLPQVGIESTGFLKLFLSTTYVDNMDTLTQLSVFDPDGRMGIKKSYIPVAKDIYVSMVARIDVVQGIQAIQLN